VLGSSVLRRIFGPKRQEEKGGWIKFTMGRFVI
jgi:hypothetical protein